MYRGALGIIETRGHVGSIEAADAMTKSAAVELIGREDVGAGHHSVTIRGDVGAVKVALQRGTAAAAQVGEILGVLFIPRPHDSLLQLFADRPKDHTHTNAVYETMDPTETSNTLRRITVAPTQPSQLESLNVPALRSLARDLAKFHPEFPLQGRTISTANRNQLLAVLRAHFEHLPQPDSHEQGSDQ